MSKYIDSSGNSNFYVFIDGRSKSRIYPTMTQMLSWLFGGTVIYTFDVQTNNHLYHIKNDDIGEYTFSVCNESFTYESASTRLSRMCEEYDGYMRYKYRDYEVK